MADPILHIFSAVKPSQHNLNDDHHSPSRSNSDFHALDRRLSSYIASTSSIWSEPTAPKSFLRAIDDLIAIRRNLNSSDTSDQRLIDDADNLLNKSMLRLEDEFTFLLKHETLPKASIDDDAIPTAIPLTERNGTIDEDRLPIASPVEPRSTSDLYQIAKRMVAGGFGKICAGAYRRVRSSSVEDSLVRLGARRWMIEELQGKPWPELEGEIQHWSAVVRPAFRDVFPGERRLCRRVFRNLTPVADLSFSEVCLDPALHLMIPPRAVADGSKAPERLFRMVDVYETLRDVMDEIETWFSDQRCWPVRSEFAAVLEDLRLSIRGVFKELENLVRCDPVKDPFPGAGVHPVTRYVVNYLRAAMASSRTLTEVMQLSLGTDSSCRLLSLREQFVCIMEILLVNIEAKAKAYRDSAQSYVFLMNNGHYVVGKVRDTELEQIVGEEWIRRLLSKVMQYHSSYQRNTWRGLVALLQVDGGDGGSGGRNAGAKAMKERIKRFNSCFEDIWRTQRGWTVVDEQLKAEIRIAAAGFVLPAYRSFLAKWSLMAMDGGKQVEKNMKYAAEDIEGRISELFHGMKV